MAKAAVLAYTERFKSVYGHRKASGSCLRPSKACRDPGTQQQWWCHTALAWGAQVGGYVTLYPPSTLKGPARAGLDHHSREGSLFLAVFQDSEHSRNLGQGRQVLINAHDSDQWAEQMRLPWEAASLTLVPETSCWAPFASIYLHELPTTSPPPDPLRDLLQQTCCLWKCAFRYWESSCPCTVSLHWRAVLLIKES